jgi:predicted restriction endonuclease
MFDIIEKYINDNKNKSQKEIYIDLITNFNKEIEIQMINFIMYDKYNYVHNDKELKIQEREKRDDVSFRKQVRERYNNCCMITGKPIEVCEVAHIYPHCESNNNDKYDIDNGFYLCTELHRLFDHPKYLMKIDPETKQIEFSDYIMNNPNMSEYHKYNNEKVNLTQNNIKYLKMKYKNDGSLSLANNK